MVGCLTWPFKALGCLILVLLLAAGWLYRDRVAGFVREHWPLGGRAAVAPDTGRPSLEGLARARDRIDSLNAWRADSTQLTAAELASLIEAGLDPVASRVLDSLEVRLEDGAIRVSAVIATASLPGGILGPLAGLVGERERIEAGGEVVINQPGQAVWIVQRLSIADFPFPGDLIPRLVQLGLGGSGTSAVPFAVPRGIARVRVHPAGVTLYRQP